MTEENAMVPAASAQPVTAGHAKDVPGDDPGGDDGAGSSGGAAAGVTYRQLRINGLRVHAEIYGEGEPLLMHSGLWAEAALWRPMLPYLPGYQVIVFDPPGVGRSDMPSVPLTMRGLAAVGTAVLDELGIGSVHDSARPSAAPSRSRWPSAIRTGYAAWCWSRPPSARSPGPATRGRSCCSCCRPALPGSGCRRSPAACSAAGYAPIQSW